MKYRYIKLWAGMMRLMICYEIGLSLDRCFFFFSFLSFLWGGWGCAFSVPLHSLERSFFGGGFQLVCLLYLSGVLAGIMTYIHT